MNRKVIAFFSDRVESHLYLQYQVTFMTIRTKHFRLLNLGVDQAKALSKLLDSESSSDEDDQKKSGDEDAEDEDETGKKKKKKKGEEGQEEAVGNEDKTDNGEDEKTKKAEKRKALVDNLLDPNVAGPSKKSRMDPFPPSAGNIQNFFFVHIITNWISINVTAFLNLW